LGPNPNTSAISTNDDPLSSRTVQGKHLPQDHLIHASLTFILSTETELKVEWDMFAALVAVQWCWFLNFRNELVPSK